MTAKSLWGEGLETGDGTLALTRNRNSRRLGAGKACDWFDFSLSSSGIKWAACEFQF